MIKAAFTALGDVLSPDFRSVLFKAVGLAILLLIAVIAGTVFVLNMLKLAPWGWGNSIIEVVGGLGVAVLAFFMIPPVTALFAGLYLDHIAGLVERKHYPQDTPGRELPTAKAILLGVQFGLLVLVVNLAVLPMLLFGVGAIVLLIVNAYLISREYFEMAAMRHMPVEEAKELRPAEYAADLCRRLRSRSACPRALRQSHRAAVLDQLLRAHLQRAETVFSLNRQRSLMRQRGHSGFLALHT